MTNNSLQICIVDDEPNRSRGWASTITSFGIPGLNIVALEMDKSRELMNKVVTRQQEIRLNPEGSGSGRPLNDIDVLVLDYDLQELLEMGQWSTGLQIVALARAFSGARLIVLINQYGTNAFDLTLTKSARSLADLDVGSDQLVNQAFWNRSLSGNNNFAPWAWGDGVLGAVGRVDKAIAWVSSHLDQPVLDCLGFTHTPDQSSSATYLSSEIWQQCLTDPTSTFREMVGSSDFLTQKDRALTIINHSDACARVGAAFIMHWLDRWVVPANGALADLPHLVSLYPWLLLNNANLDEWQRAASITNGFDAVHIKVKDFAFEPNFLISRPVVWKHKVLGNAELSEPRGFNYEGIPDLVFCEDTSRFVPFSEARPFLSRLPGVDQQRFVDAANHTSGVAYEPSVLFAL